MATLLHLPTFKDPRGKLTVMQDSIPFKVERVYYIYDAVGKRGGHRHKATTQALVCLNGSCEIYVHDGHTEHTYLLDSPEKCLILEKEDWHTMDQFTTGSTLLVLASSKYNLDDYIDEPY